jgi:S1-C subfamily serine protease
VTHRRHAVLWTAALLGAAGCTARADPRSATGNDGEAARASVLDVRASGCGPSEAFGTAALVGDGHAVTAAHVVAGATDVRVIDRQGHEHDAEVVMFDPALDVAVLSTPADIGVPLDTAQENAAAGERGVAGFARRVDGTVETRIAPVEVVRHVAIDTTDIYLAEPVTRAGFEVEADIDPGDSGAVVVIGGDAAGVIWARSTVRDRRAWAVDLPAAVRDPDRLRSLAQPVDTGPCTGRSFNR